MLVLITPFLDLALPLVLEKEYLQELYFKEN
jgi:hypothetical protein